MTVSNHLVSAKTLGRPPLPTADVPLQIRTTTKRVQSPSLSHLLSYNVVHSSTTHQPFYHTDTFTCKITSLIYCIICSKCSKMYVGQTFKSLHNRFGHQRSAAKEKRKSIWPIYCHFSSRGHSFKTHTRILPLEHCPPNQLLSCEIHLIRALQSSPILFNIGLPE